MKKLPIGEADTVVLKGRTYRIEWLHPEDLLDDAACTARWSPRRPSKEGDYGAHVGPMYNVDCDIPKGDLKVIDDDFTAFWRGVGKTLRGKVKWFALLAYADGKLAGKIRFFPKTLTLPRFAAWSKEEHRREWCDDILWIGACYVDPLGVQDGLDAELLRRVVAYARAAGFTKVQAPAASEIRTYAMWGEAFPASVYTGLGFHTIAWTPGAPDALKHMLTGCHGPRSRRLARAAIEAGVHPDTANVCQVVELGLKTSVIAGKEADATASRPPGVVGSTVLHEAALEGHVPTAQWLLAKGAGVNVRDRRGRTPLAYAKTPEMADLLRKHGGRK